MYIIEYPMSESPIQHVVEELEFRQDREVVGDVRAYAACGHRSDLAEWGDKLRLLPLADARRCEKCDAAVEEMRAAR